MKNLIILAIMLSLGTVTTVRTITTYLRHTKMCKHNHNVTNNQIADIIMCRNIRQ